MDTDDFFEEYNDDSDFSDLLFYTPKIVQHIDDAEILSFIFKKFPKLGDANKNKQEKEERKAFVDFIEEKDIVNEVLERYGLTIIDLIRLFYRHYSYIFNTVNYSAKLKRIIEENGYRTEL